MYVRNSNIEIVTNFHFFSQMFMKPVYTKSESKDSIFTRLNDTKLM